MGEEGGEGGSSERAVFVISYGLFFSFFLERREDGKGEHEII
jgi:hypothetical protein